jgi:hypothetical protein
MSRTTTLTTEHLRLLAGPEILPLIDQESSSSADFAIDGRRPSDIRLALNIKAVHDKKYMPTIVTAVLATNCGTWNELRAQVVAASWTHAAIDKFNNMTFRLEEDGKAATMTIAPTRIDAQTAFPARTYEAWYHRILRGKQLVYKVDVSIEN